MARGSSMKDDQVHISRAAPFSLSNPHQLTKSVSLQVRMKSLNFSAGLRPGAPSCGGSCVQAAPQPWAALGSFSREVWQ